MKPIYTVKKSTQLAVGDVLDLWSETQRQRNAYEVTAVDVPARTYTRRALEGRYAGKEFTLPLLPDYGEYTVYDRKQMLRLKDVLFVTKDTYGVMEGVR